MNDVVRIRRSTRARGGAWAAVWTLIVLLVAGQASVRAASDYLGQVTFNGLPVPGATVTASQGDQKVVATTDADGIYRLVDLADGAWTLVVEMLGFAPVRRDIVIPPTEAPAPLELSVLSLDTPVHVLNGPSVLRFHAFRPFNLDCGGKYGCSCLRPASVTR